jgi:predicted metalloprotease with PDZ domain
MDEFSNRYIRGNETLPLAESLQLAGIRFHHEVMDLPDRNFILWQMLRCPSISSRPDGLLVHESESEVMRPGDIIVGVAGSPIAGYDDLRRAFRDRQPASQVSIAVMREGKEVNLNVILGGQPGESVPRSPSEQVILEPMPKADPIALQIRKSLFGSRLNEARS